MNSGGCVVPRKDDVGGAEEGEKGVSGLSHQYAYVPDCLTGRSLGIWRRNFALTLYLIILHPGHPLLLS